MPFLAPVGGAILGGLKAAGPAIGGGLAKLFGGSSGKAASQLIGSGIGGWLSSKFAKPSNEATQALRSLMDLSGKAGQQADAYGSMVPTLFDTFGESVPRARFYIGEAGDSLRGASDYVTQARGQFDRAEEAYQPGLKYTTDLLRGGPAAMEAIAPEVGATQAQYEQARSTTSQFAPRGGGRAATLMELPFREGRDITNLLSTARRGAAELLPAYGSGLTQLGQGRTGLANATTNIAQVQNLLAANEAQIGEIAARLGVSMAQIQESMMRLALYGPQTALDFDIKNRLLTTSLIQAGAQAGGSVGGTMFDIIGDIAGRGDDKKGSFTKIPGIDPWKTANVPVLP